MTYDMTKLCKAAIEAYGHDWCMTMEDAEAVVSAILLELRGPDGDPVRNALTATIDHILTDPTAPR